MSNWLITYEWRMPDNRSGVVWDWTKEPSEIIDIPPHVWRVRETERLGHEYRILFAMEIKE